MRRIGVSGSLSMVNLLTPTTILRWASSSSWKVKAASSISRWM